MNQIWRNLYRSVSTLALLAAFAAALLPDGSMPKIAGPCGRMLCNCPVESVIRHECEACHHHDSSERKSNAALRLVESSISGAETPGLAFHIVFSGVLVPNKSVLPSTVALEVSRANAENDRCLVAVYADIATPPPKA